MAKAAKKKASAKVSKTKVNKVEVAAPVVEQPQAQPAIEEQAQDDAQLTIADLQGIAQVIDMAVRRGAFGANEAVEVGTIYNKLAGFLQVIAQQKQDAEGGA